MYRSLFEKLAVPQLVKKISAFYGIVASLPFDICTVHCWAMHRKPTLCTGFRVCIYYNAAPTCFGTYVPSLGSVFVLVSNVKTKAAMYGYVCRT
jgi:hypothetical protein